LELTTGARVTDDDWNTNVKILFGFVLGLVAALVFHIGSHVEHWNWGNIAEWVTGAATAGLIGMAGYQLWQQTFQQRQWATLQACDRYDSDAVLTQARLLLNALKAGETVQGEDHEIEATITTLFNYFDAIAIGLDQKLYVEEIVKKHLEEIMFGRLVDLWTCDHPVLRKFREKDFRYFPTLNRLLETWDSKRYDETIGMGRKAE
jgi:hypothetical protein